MSVKPARVAKSELDKLDPKPTEEKPVKVEQPKLPPLKGKLRCVLMNDLFQLARDYYGDKYPLYISAQLYAYNQLKIHHKVEHKGLVYFFIED